MHIDVDGLEDSIMFIKKLIKVLTNEQLRAVLHTFYSGCSGIRSDIEAECIKRGISIEIEFTEDGNFKY